MACSPTSVSILPVSRLVKTGPQLAGDTGTAMNGGANQATIPWPKKGGGVSNSQVSDFLDYPLTFAKRITSEKAVATGCLNCTAGSLSL